MEPPTEPTDTPVPSGELVPAIGGTPPRKKRKGTLLIVLAIVALLCLGGGATAFVYYDRATQPDLRTPVVVTLEYLRAYLVDRDDVKAAEFQCGDGSGLKDVKALRDDIDSRQKTFNVAIVASIDSAVETSRSGSTANVSSDIVLSTTSDGTSLRRVQHWQFTTRNDGGWRVCDGHEVT
jgi:hypothetical protein